jgi:hypothetical protein
MLHWSLVAWVLVLACAVGGCGGRADPPGPVSQVPPFPCIGKWKSHDAKGKEFEFTIEPGGVVTSNRANAPTGVWTSEGKLVTIVWSNQWREQLGPVGNGYQRAVYPPYSQGLDIPEYTAPAERLDAQKP